MEERRKALFPNATMRLEEVVFTFPLFPRGTPAELAVELPASFEAVSLVGHDFPVSPRVSVFGTVVAEDPTKHTFLFHFLLTGDPYDPDIVGKYLGQGSLHNSSIHAFWKGPKQ